MIRIRPMMPEDCKEVVQIDQACFSDAWSLSMFEDVFQYPEHHYFVAELERQNPLLVGFAGVLTSIDTADVMNIGVLPEYRKQGIGSLFLQKLEEMANINKCEQMMLEVRESNTPAIYLYQKHGFEPIAIRKNYYSNPTEHGIVMQKKLNAAANHYHYTENV